MPLGHESAGERGSWVTSVVVKVEFAAALINHCGYKRATEVHLKLTLFRFAL
jgi:hypothetical protein